MHLGLLAIYLVLATAVTGNFFSDIVHGLLDSDRFPNLFKLIPNSTKQGLEQDGDNAAQFICQILQGDLPAAFEDVAADIKSAAESDYSAFTSFVLAIPTLAPEVLSDILQGGEDVVSIVEELVTNPGAALTVIVDNVETVFQNMGGDIQTVGEEIGSDIKCAFGNCAASTTTVDSAAMFLSSTCQVVLANAAPSTFNGLTSTTTATPAAASTVATSTTIHASAPTTTTDVAVASGNDATSTVLGAAGTTTGYTVTPLVSPESSTYNPNPQGTISTMTTQTQSSSSSPAQETPNSASGDHDSTAVWVWLASLSCVMGMMMML